MQPNLISLFVAALVPVLLGMLWHHPAVFGRAWARGAGMTDEQVAGRNRMLAVGLTYLFGLLISGALLSIVIHQAGIMSLMADDPSRNDPQSETGRFLAEFLSRYGNKHRTFGHGAVHGTLAGLFLAAPIIGFYVLSERKPFRYFAINAGFWIVCLAIMGAVICGWT
jgi:hypothetical protein